ncbi:MAG TPA: SpoIIE family protein phosphatase [Bacteroidales bacterium]|nr:SpoIIE family protein phosphatase [Bacteroidales bacterium]
MKNFLLVFFMLSFSCFLCAQEGAPLLTHFRENRDIENQNWAICQDSNLVMLFANRKGLLSFDGEDWTQIRLRTTPYTLRMNPFNKTIYVGGENNYGYIEKDPRGSYKYHSMSGDSAFTGIITRIILNDSLVCFYGDQSINCHNFVKNSAVKRYYPQQGSLFTGAFLKGDKMFVNVSGKGLHRIEADTLFPIVTGYLTERTDILFSLPYDDDRILLGLSSSKLSLFDGIKYYDYPVKDDGYLENNILSEGICIGDSLYAFSTLGGGAVVTEKKTGKVLFTINNQKGLPDDEVFALGCDEAGGLWLSHMYGLSRADLRLPVGNYAIYPGLSGNVSAALKYNNELYVATSEGVFYLSREKSYTEIEVLRKNEVRQSFTTSAEPVREITTPIIAPKQQNTRKSIFNRIFSKKNSGVPETGISNPEPQNRLQQQAITVRDIPEIAYRKEKIRKLKSIDYIYKKIPGVNVRCRQLVPTVNGMLAATNRGLYVINDHTATAIVTERYINSVTWNAHSGKFGIAAADGYMLAGFEMNKWSVSVPDKSFTQTLYSVINTDGNTLWMSGDNVAIRVEPDNSGTPVSRRYPVKSEYIQRCLLNIINDTLFLFTETGLNYYDEIKDDFISYRPFNQENRDYRYPLSNFPVIISGAESFFPERNSTISTKDLCVLKLFDDIVSVYKQNGNIWIVDGSGSIYGIDSKTNASSKPETALMVKKIMNEKGTLFDLSEIIFERGDNVINFEIVVPSFLNRNITEYQYYIDRVMTDWSPWSTRTSYSRGIPRAGNYILRMRARDMWGNVGEPVPVNFVMKAPFTKTTLFYVLVILTGLGIISGIVWFRERQLQAKNRVLEEKVRERTAELAAQKEEITSSIEYASRIQMAMLPMTNVFAETFPDYFIIFKPRDIVSGDFYWIGEDGKNIYLTVADCTGHGVPGAFMSTLGISILNEIVTHKKNLQANSFLNLLREQIKTMLHQTGKEGETADGMDISLCVISKNRQSIQFAGAYNSLYVHSAGEIKEIKADRMPIGIHYGEEVSFTNNEMKIKKGDIIYLLSDGLTDQFGGPEGSKFKKAQLKKILSEIHGRPLAEQRKLIELEFMKWKGNNEQVDDVTVVGVRV